MSNGLDKNVLMVAVVGVVAVVGLFALLGGGDATGHSVGGVNAYKKCLEINAEAINEEEACDSRFPRLSDDPSHWQYDRRGRTGSSWWVEFEYPEEEKGLEQYQGRHLEGGDTLDSTASHSYLLKALKKKVAGNPDAYLDSESWIRCRMAGDADCDRFKRPSGTGAVVTGNFVNIFKACMSMESKKGTENADVYCMCREARGYDCRERFDRPGVERAGFDNCVAAFDNNAYRRGETGSSTTKDKWLACNSLLGEA